MLQTIQLDQALVIPVLSFLSTAFGALLGAWATSRGQRISATVQKDTVQNERQFAYLHSLFNDYNEAYEQFLDEISRHGDALPVSHTRKSNFLIGQMISLLVASGDETLQKHMLAIVNTDFDDFEKLLPVLSLGQTLFGVFLGEYDLDKDKMYIKLAEMAERFTDTTKSPESKN